LSLASDILLESFCIIILAVVLYVWKRKLGRELSTMTTYDCRQVQPPSRGPEAPRTIHNILPVLFKVFEDTNLELHHCL
jgi:hypothetical protein